MSDSVNWERATHARALLITIKQLDEFIERSVTTGDVPLLDAVEASKLLKALVYHQRSYSPDLDSVRRRAARSESGYTVSAIGISWKAGDI